MSLNPKTVVDQSSAEFAAGRASRNDEIERLRAELKNANDECTVRNDEVTGLIGMNAELRAERDALACIALGTISLREHDASCSYLRSSAKNTLCNCGALQRVLAVRADW